jgi:hypothetical protein
MIYVDTPPHMPVDSGHQLKSFRRSCYGIRALRSPRDIWEKSAMQRRYGGSTTFMDNSTSSRAEHPSFGPAMFKDPVPISVKDCSGIL